MSNISSDDGLNGYNLFSAFSNNPLMYNFVGNMIGSIFIGSIANKLEIQTDTKLFYDVDNDSNKEVFYGQGTSKLCWAYCQVVNQGYLKGQTMQKEDVKIEAQRLAYEVNGTEYDKDATSTNKGKIVTYDDFQSHPDYNKQRRLYNMLYWNQGPLYCSFRANDGYHQVLLIGIDFEKEKIYIRDSQQAGLSVELSYNDFWEYLDGFHTVSYTT